MLVCFLSIICYWYCFLYDGVCVDVEIDDDLIGGYFFYMFYGEKLCEFYE